MEANAQELYINNAQRLVWKFISVNKWVIKLFGSVEDASQALLLAVWQKLNKYDSKKAKFSIFVYIVCKNSAGQQYRKSENKIKYIKSDIDLMGNGTENSFINKLANKISIDHLKSNLPKSALLYYLKGVKQSDIAKNQKITSMGVSNQINRKIKKCSMFIAENTL